MYLAVNQEINNNKFVSWPLAKRGDLGVSRAAASDVLWSRFFRPLRLGVHQFKSVLEIKELLERMADIWSQRSPHIPISNGDSWTSYTRRVSKGYKLARSRGDKVVVPVDLLTVKCLRDIASQRPPKPEEVLSEWLVPAVKVYRLYESKP